MQNIFSQKYVVWGVVIVVFGVAYWGWNNRNKPKYKFKADPHRIDYSNGMWKIMRWEHLKASMQQHIDSMFLRDNQNTVILKEIESMKVRMPHLTRLDVSGNHIESIEALTLIYLPCLQYLEIFNNNISRIKSIRKLMSTSLMWLQIHNNPIVDFQAISELSTPNLQWLWVQLFQTDQTGQISHNWLIKIQAIYLTKTFMMGSRQIKQNRLTEICKRKFLNLDLRQ